MTGALVVLPFRPCHVPPAHRGPRKPIVSESPSEHVNQSGVVYLMAGVQFANILDFMMVNPLGPRLAEGLAIPVSQLPIVVGSYTAAASITGLLGFLFLDRFDRRTALVVLLLGLAVGTALGGLATGLGTLVLARVVAGAFGGPATSISFAIVADTIPPARRGWAMGIVMGGFSVASVLGVPAGLTLARLGGWRTPFFGVGGIIVIAAFVALRLLPPLRSHIKPPAARGASSEGPGLARGLLLFLRDPTILVSLGLSAITMMSGFIVIPNIAAYAQNNLGFPAEHLEWLYLLGGIASFATTRVTGPLVDRWNPARICAYGTGLLVVIVWLWFVDSAVHVPILVLSTGFFIAMGIRGVAYNTLTSKVAQPADRARFQSAQSAIQHAASALAAFVSAQLLSESADHKLLHVERVAYASIVLSISVPIMMLAVERALARRALRDAAEAPALGS